MALRGMGIDNWEDPYISGEISFLKRFARAIPAAVVFDVGANVGQYAELVKPILPASKLYSFEPHPESFKELSKLAASRGFQARPVALSDESGEARRFDHKSVARGSEHATLFRDVIEVSYDDESPSWGIEVTTLDQFVREEGIDRIDLLKIDVEGAEMKVLAGARDTLAEGRIAVIQFEYTAANVVTRLFMRDYVDVLSDYTLYRLLPDGLASLQTYNTAVFEICGYQNIVAVRKGSSISL